MLFNPIFDLDHTPYCGPAAIALLTGVPLSRIEKMLRRCRRGYRDSNGRKLPIKGTYTGEVLKVLKRLGCKVESFTPLTSTLAKFCDDTRHIGAAFLVEVTGHFVTAFAGTMADNGHPAPVPAEGCRHAARHVRKAWRIEAPTTPHYTVHDAIDTPRAAKPKMDIKLARAVRLEAQIKGWETKERRARNALKKLRAKRARYVRLGVLQES